MPDASRADAMDIANIAEMVVRDFILYLCCVSVGVGVDVGVCRGGGGGGVNEKGFWFCVLRLSCHK